MQEYSKETDYNTVASRKDKWLETLGKPLATVAGEQKKLVSSPAPILNCRTDPMEVVSGWRCFGET